MKAIKYDRHVEIFKEDEFWKSMYKQMRSKREDRSHEKLIYLLNYMRLELSCWGLPCAQSLMSVMAEKNIRKLIKKQQFTFERKQEIVLESLLVSLKMSSASL